MNNIYLNLSTRRGLRPGVQPLAFDNDLSEAAEGHSRWMLATDTFSHTGSGGSTPTQRMKAAGYTLAGLLGDRGEHRVGYDQVTDRL